MTTILICVPAQEGQASQVPCPAGQVVSTVEYPTPPLLSEEEAFQVAGIIAAPLMVLFAVSIAFGWIFGRLTRL